MTIFCATDFSPSSQQATQLAGAIARRLGDELVLVHVIEPVLQAVPYALPGAMAWEAEMKASADAALAAEAKTLRDRGLSVACEVVVGSAAPTLLSLIEQRKPRLVVMGTHGRKGVGRLFLGSVAAKVVGHAASPVLVTPGGPGISERWDSAAPLRLAVGIDGTKASEAAVGWLPSLPSNFAEPTLIRLYWPFEEAIRYGVDEPWQGVEANPALLPLMERDVRHLASPFLAEGKYRLSLSMAHVNAPQVFLDEAARFGVDALVVAVPAGRMQAWNALEVNDILRTSRMPVFCVPQTAVRPRSKRLGEFRSMLIATDLSDASNQAIPLAYGAIRPGGRVELIHVHAYQVQSGLAEPLAPSARIELRPLSDDDRRSIEARLRDLVPPEAGSRGIVTNVSVIDAPNTPMAILQAAERLDVDLLALASHQRKGVKRAVLGSVAEEVTRGSSRPVLITPTGREG